MRKPAVEIDGRSDDGDLGQRQGDQRDDPPVMWHRVLRVELYWPRIETAPRRAVRLLAAKGAAIPPVMWLRVLRVEIFWPRIETAPLRAVRLLAARAATMLTSVRASTGFAT